MYQTSSIADAPVAEIETALIGKLLECAMCTLVVYEYIISIAQECAMVWRRKQWNLATWIFVANRYLTIAIVILQVSPIAGQLIEFAQGIIFAVFSTLWVYIIWGRSLLVALPVMTLNLVPLGIDIYSYAHETNVFVEDPILGALCISTLDIPATVYFRSALLMRLAVIAADIVVLTTTWHKTLKSRRNQGLGVLSGTSAPVVSLLLRHGTVYFGILLAVNIAAAVVDALQFTNNVTPAGVIISILTPISISRFLLNLRQLNEPETDNQGTFPTPSSVLRFYVPSLEIAMTVEILREGSPDKVSDDSVKTCPYTAALGEEEAT